MNISDFREYCLSKMGATESFPFDNRTLVFKVGKMFALCDIEQFSSLNLKCDPEKAIGEFMFISNPPVLVNVCPRF